MKTSEFKMPYGTFSDRDSEVRKAYYTYGYRKDEDIPECEPTYWEDDIEDPFDVAFRNELICAVQEVLEWLPIRYRKVLSLRFGIGCHEATLAEVAQALGVSIARARQIELDALRKVWSRYPRALLNDFLQNRR